MHICTRGVLGRNSRLLPPKHVFTHNSAQRTPNKIFLVSISMLLRSRNPIDHMRNWYVDNMLACDTDAACVAVRRILWTHSLGCWT